MSIEAIGKQIASLRKEKGARQEELAKYVGVSAQAVSKWENGFVALLIFAREMIDRPEIFAYYSGGRTEPYFKQG